MPEKLKVLFSRKITAVSAIFIIALILISIFAGLITPYGPDAQNLANRLQTSSLSHLLGTDNYGRDVLSRIIFGSRISLIVAFVSVFVAGIIGSLIGLIAGYCGGLIDGVIMRFTEALMAFPSIIFALGIAAALGQSTINLIIALGISTIPPYVRTIRGEVLKVRNQTYIKAGRVIGETDLYLMMHHVLPNCISPVIVTATIGLGATILTEASLSFLGLGIVPPTASWGVMVSDGSAYLTSYPHLAIAPGIAIALVVLAFNFLGDGIRDALDPHIRDQI